MKHFIYLLILITLPFFGCDSSVGPNAGSKTELQQMILNGEYVTNFDTSGITDMSHLFDG